MERDLSRTSRHLKDMSASQEQHVWVPTVTYRGENVETPEVQLVRKTFELPQPQTLEKKEGDHDNDINDKSNSINESNATNDWSHSGDENNGANDERNRGHESNDAYVKNNSGDENSDTMVENDSGDEHND